MQHNHETFKMWKPIQEVAIFAVCFDDCKSSASIQTPLSCGKDKDWLENRNTVFLLHIGIPSAFMSDVGGLKSRVSNRTWTQTKNCTRTGILARTEPEPKQIFSECAWTRTEPESKNIISVIALEQSGSNSYGATICQQRLVAAIDSRLSLYWPLSLYLFDLFYSYNYSFFHYDGLMVRECGLERRECKIGRTVAFWWRQNAKGRALCNVSAR